MSNKLALARAKVKALQSIETLKKRAATGDVIAREQLRQLFARATQQQRAQSQALAVAKRAAEVVVGRDINAPDPAPIYTPDRLEIADVVAASVANMDSLDRKVAARHAEWQQLDGTAAFVRSNPPSVLAGILGNQATCESGGDLKDVANWSGDDVESTAVTITLAPVVALPLPVPSPLWRPFARITWGSQGFSSSAEVDIGQGTQFTIAASSVRVQVGLDEVPAGTTTAPLNIVGALSFGTIERNQAPLTRTRYLDNALNTPSTESIVGAPQFAKNVVVWRGGVGGEYGFELNFLDYNGVNRYRYLQAVNTFMLTPVPLTPDTFQLALTNTLPGVNNARLIFGLSL